MTMHLSAPLQRALYERLTGAPELTALNGRVFDDAPQNAGRNQPGPYVTLGEETVTPWNTATEAGASHLVVIGVHAPRRGFTALKETAAQIANVIEASPPAPSRGHIVTHEFAGAQTQREDGGALRRIDLSFRFVIEDDPSN